MADITRPNYFTSQLLVEGDFKDEQAYHVGMRRRHNKLLHAWGIADGLDVTLNSGKQVRVSPGTAIDSEGREIVLLDARNYDINASSGTIYLTIKYAEDTINAAYKYMVVDTAHYTRFLEQPIVEEATVQPAENGPVVVLARITLTSGAVSSIDKTICTASVKLAPGTVETRHLANGSVTADKLASNALGNGGAITITHDIPNKKITIGETHSALSVAHGATGAVVGTTNTQTLTNKTLTQPTLTLKQGSAPTAEGDIQWDATNDQIKVGSGATTKVFSDDSSLLTQAKDIAVPAGAVIPFAAINVPAGWLECNGQAISRTTYSRLFTTIGTTFGPGDGSTSFNVPDLRGEFIRGWDHGRNVDTSRTFGSSQSNALGIHRHADFGHTHGGYTSWSGAHQHSAYAPWWNDVNNETCQGWPASDNHQSFRTSDRGRERAVHSDAISSGGSHNHTITTYSGTASIGDPTGTSTAAETRPRNIALMYCIKY